MTMTRAAMIACLDCGCPAAIKDGGEDWICPNCGCGFVRLEVGP